MSKIKPKTKCVIDGCERISNRKSMCFMHYHRIRSGINDMNPDPLGSYGIKGENNANWKGGVSEYPNHYEMKRIRKIVLEEENYTCHFCGKEANQIHHKDLSKGNHSRKNLVAVCPKCQMKFKKPYTSKYKKEYGLTLKDMVDRYGGSQSKYSLLESQGRLKEFLLSS